MEQMENRKRRNQNPVRETLSQVFCDTKKLFRSHPKLLEACKKSRENQRVYASSEKIALPSNRFGQTVKITVSKKRTFEAASSYARAGEKVAVLNFANSFHPGGGVVHGARAQEESLCRVSTLYDALTSPKTMRLFYEVHRKTEDNLGTDDVIFTPDVAVFKSDTDIPKIVPESEWFFADVLTCAAPNIFYGWKTKIDISEDALFELFEKRARRIVGVAAENNVDALILGAFGCGAFGNSPQIVSRAFKTVLLDFQFSFKTVEFAVFCSPRDSLNFDAFQETFA